MSVESGPASRGVFGEGVAWEVLAAGCEKDTWSLSAFEKEQPGAQLLPTLLFHFLAGVELGPLVTGGASLRGKDKSQ